MSMSTQIFNTLPTVNQEYVEKLLLQEGHKYKGKIIILDDDPTGTQTVSGISVYTCWDKASILQAFKEESKTFFILTNSRSLTAQETTTIHHQISEVIANVSKELDKDYIIISRSDSTLRGHYPLETQILKNDYEQYTGKKVDAEIICPFFKEGGRVTINNIHYAQYGDTLIPVCETEFAKDKTFGYKAHTLPEYIEEKTKGEYPQDTVKCITLEQLRNLHIEEIEEQLMKTKGFEKVVVNAADYIDIKIFCIALYRALLKGKNFMYRTAAAFTKVMSLIESRPLLTGEELMIPGTHQGGVIIIGSHTKKTTQQLENLREIKGIEFVELNASLVEDNELFNQETKRCLEIEERFIKEGKTVCCYTSRELLVSKTDNKEDNLRLSIKISEAVQSLVGDLEVEPSFIVAKGGITSSDIATKGLRVKRALVLGQIRPGIPVWQIGKESKFPQIPYVIFPGNVGTSETLREVVEILMG